MMAFQFTTKQAEAWRQMVLEKHRWNIKSGATRSGKTYLDYFQIMRRITSMKGKTGAILFLGNTKGTLERNVFEPMRQIWGESLIGTVNNRNEIWLFGQMCYAIGADKVTQVNKIRGMSVKYCYGDEVTTWNEDVFDMLKSRLDKPYSLFDGTCNPDHPDHWFKQFLDSDADIAQMHFTIYDNTFNSESFIRDLEKEYQGTVYWHRYILGQWVRAEGVIYSKFAADSEKYRISAEDLKLKKIQQINIGVDFGGNKSGHTFVATAILRGYSGIVALSSERHFKNKNGSDIDPDDLGKLFTDFVQKILVTYGRADYAYCDSAEQVLIRGLKKAAEKLRLPITIRNADKKEINDRIRATVSLIGQNRFFYTDDCQTLKKALSDAIWSDKTLDDLRLDDGTTDIDTLDGFEYSFEKEIKHLMDYRGTC